MYLSRGRICKLLSIFFFYILKNDPVVNCFYPKLNSLVVICISLLDSYICSLV